MIPGVTSAEAPRVAHTWVSSAAAAVPSSAITPSLAVGRNPSEVVPSSYLVNPS